MQAVGHDFRGQGSVGGEELVADVHEEDLFVVCQFRELAVDLQNTTPRPFDRRRLFSFEQRRGPGYI